MNNEYSNLLLKEKMEVFLSRMTHNAWLLANRLDGFISEAFGRNGDLKNTNHLQVITSKSLAINAELTKQIAEYFSFSHPEYSKLTIPEGASKIILLYSTLNDGKSKFSCFINENRNMLPSGVIEHFERYIFPNYEELLENLMQENPEILTNYSS
ncbi:hypothetical protein A7M79_00785 [Acinetobacter baumannii]|uniref:hypothetical protein n=1 Tax=Acinetobacter baumannii TaxID=470 RepID=UPI0008DC8A17|nr:hypothetical protein [Acinetobacter baumannii]OIH12054.1 hypothetical protein A7M79_00785 [Acinetobacter baumannii]